MNSAIGRVQMAAAGKIRVVYSSSAQGTRLKLSLAQGWHINADASVMTDPSLIPTRIEVIAGDAVVRYPAAVGTRLEGDVTFDIEGTAQVIALTLQPCSNSLCLAAETLRFSCG